MTDDLDTLNFNTAVSQMMIFVNHMLSQDSYSRETLYKFLIILNPFAPHLSEELNEKLSKENYSPITEKPWPAYDEKLIASDTITIAVQINGKTRGTIDIEVDENEHIIFDKILNNNKLNKYIDGMNIIRKIYVPNKIVNIVIK